MNDLAEHRFAIEQRLHGISYANDTRDLEAYLDVFAEDWVGHGFRVGDDEPFAIHGREDLRAAFEGFPAIRVLHHLMGVVFDEVTSDTARTRTTVLVTAQESTESDPFVLNHAHYYDEWRKFPDAWRIESRRFLNWGLRARSEELFGA